MGVRPQYRQTDILLGMCRVAGGSRRRRSASGVANPRRVLTPLSAPNATTSIGRRVGQREHRYRWQGFPEFEGLSRASFTWLRFSDTSHALPLRINLYLCRLLQRVGRRALLRLSCARQTGRSAWSGWPATRRQTWRSVPSPSSSTGISACAAGRP